MHLRAVAFAGREACSVRSGLARENTDARLLSGFSKRIARLEHFFLAAKAARGLGTEVITQREKNLRSKRLQKRPPALTWQSGTQRTDALCRHNWNALSLARESKKLLVTGWVVLADSCESLVFI